MKKNFNKLKEISKKIAIQSSISSLLGWDQETYMPKDGIEIKSLQLEYISSQMHKDQTSKEFEENLAKLIELKSGKYKSCISLCWYWRLFHIYWNYFKGADESIWNCKWFSFWSWITSKYLDQRSNSFQYCLILKYSNYKFESLLYWIISCSTY